MLSESSTAVLEPKLTPWDKRVLAKLDVWRWSECNGKPKAEWPEFEWKNAWQVAEALHHDDVAEVRATLEGLVDFRYATARLWGHRREWIAEEKRG